MDGCQRIPSIWLTIFSETLHIGYDFKFARVTLSVIDTKRVNMQTSSLKILPAASRNDGTTIFLSFQTLIETSFRKPQLHDIEPISHSHHVLQIANQSHPSLVHGKNEGKQFRFVSASLGTHFPSFNHPSQGTSSEKISKGD